MGQDAPTGMSGGQQKNGLMLTVTRIGANHWVAVVVGEGVTGRSPALATWLAARRWADKRAGGAS